MNLRIPAPRFAALSLMAFLGTMGLGTASAADWAGLTGNSPFGQATGPATAAAPDQLEFRGVVQEEGVYLVNLFNPTTKTSQWIPVKGKAPGLEVKSYDSGADKVEVMQGSKALTLPLKQAHVTLMQAPSPAAAANNNQQDDGNRQGDGRDGGRGRFGGGGNNGEPPMVRNLPPEAQAMIEEFRRRRSERANQQGGTGQQQPQAQQQQQQQQQSSPQQVQVRQSQGQQRQRR